VRSSPLDPASPTPAATPASPQEPTGELVAGQEAGALLQAGEPGSGGGFLGSALAELSKVVWPSRQQLFSETVAVILMVGLSAAAIAAIDRFYGWVAHQVFR